MQSINPMVTTLVQHIMVKDNDIDAWRQDLIRNHVFEAQEAKDLSEREISLIHHALMIQNFSRMSSDQLIEMANRYDVHYSLHFSEDEFQVGAVGY